MSLRKLIVTLPLALVIWAVTPARASADWLFTPFIGTVFGGTARVAGLGQSFGSDFGNQLNWGASLAGGGVASFELDFGYSPNFYRDSKAGLNFIGDGNVTTLMANLMIGAKGPVRPYVVGGGGLMKSSADSVGQFLTKADSSDFGFDVGGGLILLFGGVGIRGDLRYFRSTRNADPGGVDIRFGDLRFWRGTAGVTFKF